MPLNAQQLEQQYGALLRQSPLSECPSAYLLHRAVASRTPPIDVSAGAVREWWNTYKAGQVEHTVSSAKALEEQYGDRAKALAVNNTSGYLLVRALRGGQPPVYISDGVARQWLKQYFNLSQIDNAGHLESRYGEPLREHIKQHPLDATGVSQWLVSQHQVSVPPRICQHWLARDWSSSGMLLTPEAVEESVGARLRLDEYREQLVNDVSAEMLSQVHASYTYIIYTYISYIYIYKSISKSYKRSYIYIEAYVMYIYIYHIYIYI